MRIISGVLKGKSVNNRSAKITFPFDKYSAIFHAGEVNRPFVYTTI